MKKLASILTTLVLALQLTTAYAAGTPTATVSKAEGFAGDTVEVTVSVANVEQWNNINLEVGYNADVLTLDSVVQEAIDGTTAVQSRTEGTNPWQTGWSSMSAQTYNGLLATYTFVIAEDATAGVYPITVDFYKGPTGKYKDGSSCNYWEDEYYDAYPIGFTYVDGSITVKSTAPAEPTLAAEETSSGVSITATHPTAMTGKFIVAGYDADGLVAVEVLDAAATATSTVKADTIKVMWWDSLTGLTSIAPAVTL